MYILLGGKMAIIHIQKWGNSYGLRIPKNIIDEMELQPDTQIDIHQEQGKIVLTPIYESEVLLAELLEQITPENLHRDVDWGNSVGNEAW
jgi:antitoxin MazE